MGVETLRLTVSTLGKTLLSTSYATRVTLPTIAGIRTILPRHVPTLFQLRNGVISADFGGTQNNGLFVPTDGRAGFFVTDGLALVDNKSEADGTIGSLKVEALFAVPVSWLDRKALEREIDKVKNINCKEDAYAM